MELTGERFLEAAIHRLRAEVTLDQWPCRTEEVERLLLSAGAVADAQGTPRLRRRAELALHTIREGAQQRYSSSARTGEDEVGVSRRARA